MTDADAEMIAELTARERSILEVRDAMARAIYELEPFEVSGEHIDGFKVSPDGQLSWANVVTMAAEFDDDPVLPYRTYVNDCHARADAALSALEAAGFEVTKAGTIPRDLAELVVHIGKAEWGSTPEHDADGHADHVRESVRITAEHFGQTEPQKMHGLYVEGTETVVCHTGTGPNSPQIARALTGAWNYLHERCVAMLSASNPKEIAQQAKDAP